MTDKELKKLGRAELLEILLNQSKEVESLRQQLEEAQVRLKNRQIELDEAGNIAEAALKINKVFEAAQEASAQYLENIASLNERQSTIFARLEKDSQEKADKLLAETQEYCEKMKRETEKKCAETTEKAKADAQKYWDEVSGKLEEFYASHKGLKELLSVHVSDRL